MSYLFFHIHIPYFSSGQKECPGEPIKNSYNGPIKDLIANNSYGKRYPKKFFYQEMHMPVDELESKKPVKVCVILVETPYYLMIYDVFCRLFGVVLN